MIARESLCVYVCVFLLLSFLQYCYSWRKSVRAFYRSYVHSAAKQRTRPRLKYSDDDCNVRALLLV